MGASGLTPEDIELHLNDLRERLTAFLERGEGKVTELRKGAEQVFALRDEFVEVFERHGDVEGLVAEFLAREKQYQFIGGQEKPEKRGCLLGWLFRGGKS